MALSRRGFLTGAAAASAAVALPANAHALQYDTALLATDRQQQRFDLAVVKASEYSELGKNALMVAIGPHIKLNEANLALIEDSSIQVARFLRSKNVELEAIVVVVNPTQKENVRFFPFQNGGLHASYGNGVSDGRDLVGGFIRRSAEGPSLDGQS